MGKNIESICSLQALNWKALQKKKNIKWKELIEPTFAACEADKKKQASHETSHFLMCLGQKRRAI